MDKDNITVNTGILRKKTINIINTLFDTYKNNTKIEEKIYHYVNNNLINVISKMNINIKHEENIKSIINEFIQDFFVEDNSYFYISSKDTFIYYNDVKYQLIEEDDITLKLFELIKEDDELKCYKRQIANEIITKMKTNSLQKSIPESNTICFLNTFFIPNLLTSKTDMKYLYCILGDSILKKDNNHIFYFNIEAKDFFDILNDLLVYYFGIRLPLNIKYKYHQDHDYKLCRILNFNIAVKNKVFWNSFLKDNIFNIYVVSCYYSIRYGGSEKYLNGLLDLNKCNILFLKNNTQDNIINMFVKKMLVKVNDEKKEININNMYFLWKMFIKHQNIPNIIYKNTFYALLNNKIKRHDKNYIGYGSEYLSNIKRFQSFWSETMIDGLGDEIELNELFVLYQEWYKDKGDFNTHFDEDKMYELIQYFYPTIDIKDNKFILNKTNLLWDKSSMIENGLDIKFDKKIKTKISFNKLYKYYCSFSKNKNNKIASKNYFINVINKIIPKEYIKNNMILDNYWLNI
jgi:hypothetical protein